MTEKLLISCFRSLLTYSLLGLKISILGPLLGVHPSCAHRSSKQGQRLPTAASFSPEAASAPLGTWHPAGEAEPSAMAATRLPGATRAARGQCKPMARELCIHFQTGGERRNNLVLGQDLLQELTDSSSSKILTEASHAFLYSSFLRKPRPYQTR